MNQIEIRFKSSALMMNAQILVLLPETLGGEKLKVLWLLHGGTEDYHSWLEKVDLDRVLNAHPGVMAVLPNGLNSDFADHFEFAGGFDFPRFFFAELMPFVYHAFPASPLPEDNFLTGYSMGGAGALMLGLLRPDCFGGIAPMGASERRADFLQPYLQMAGPEFRRFARAQRTALPTEYGDPALGITDKEINMIARYETVQDYVDSMECTAERYRDRVREKAALPELYFVCGEADGCRAAAAEFVTRAAADKTTGISLHLIPGCGHEQAAQPAVEAVLDHFLSGRPRRAEGRP